jgi:hypothetical protein
MTETSRPALLGAILRDARIIRDEDVRRALAEQERSGLRFGEALIRLGLVSREDVSWALAGQLDLPFVRVRPESVDPAAIASVPAEIARRHRLLPYLLLDKEITIVVDEPPDATRRAAMERDLGTTVNVCLGLAEEIDEALVALYGPAAEPPPAPTTRPSTDLRAKDLTREEIDAVRRDPSGKALLDAVLALADRRFAASVHVEPAGARFVVRFAEGDRLVPRMEMAPAAATALIANARSAFVDEIAAPGEVSGFLQTGRAARYRAALVETDLGPTLTLTRFDPPGFPATFADAATDPADRKALRELLTRRAGLLVVAGSDGPRTLRLVASLLAEMDRARRKPFHVGRANWFAPLAVPHLAVRADRTTADAVAAAAMLGGDPLVVTEIDGNAAVRAVLAAADRLVIAPLGFASGSDALEFLVAGCGNAPLVAARVVGVLAFAAFPELPPAHRVAKALTPALAGRLGLPWRKGARIYERRPPSATRAPDVPRDVLAVDVVAGRAAIAQALTTGETPALRAKALALLASGRIALRDLRDRFER